MLAEIDVRPSPSVVELHYAVTALNNEYAALLDAERFEEWAELFTEDATYRVIPRENYVLGLPIASIHCESRGMIEDRVYAARESTMSEPRTLRHLVTNVRVLEHGDDEIRAEAHVLVVQTLSRRMTEIVLSGVYLDRIVAAGGRLRFRERLCVYDSLLVPTSLVCPV